MSVKYLQKKIVASKESPIDPRRYMTREGYTKRSGAPTPYLIRLDGEKKWRRLMAWQFSNAGTAFVRVNGENLIVRDFRP